MGRRRDGNYYLQKNNLMENSEGNEENLYPVPDPNKTMINNTKEPSNTHKTPSKKKSCKKSLRISWRRY
jgi:hypothetical protein